MKKNMGLVGLTIMLLVMIVTLYFLMVQDLTQLLAVQRIYQCFPNGSNLVTFYKMLLFCDIVIPLMFLWRANPLRAWATQKLFWVSLFLFPFGLAMLAAMPVAGGRRALTQLAFSVFCGSPLGAVGVLLVVHAVCGVVLFCFPYSCKCVFVFKFLRR